MEMATVRTALQQISRFPFPCVALTENGKILARNRLAQKLLPPAAALSRHFLRDAHFLSAETLFWTVLEEVEYFIGILKKRWEGEEIRLVCFLENFLPLQEPFAEYLLEEGSRLFGEAAGMLDEPKGQAPSPQQQDALCALLFRMRTQNLSYLRFCAHKHFLREAEAVCSLGGLFDVLETVLARARVRFAASMQEEMNVYAAPDALSRILLNVLQFVSLFTGEEKLSMKAKQNGACAEVCISFADQDGLFLLFGGLLGLEKEKDVFPRALVFSPLFSALAICRAQGYDLCLSLQEETGEIRLRVPSADRVPEAFLSSAKEKEILVLLEKLNQMGPWQ